MMNTIRFPFKVLCLLILGLSLVACGKTQEYSSIEPGQEPGRSRANLELPPDLAETASDRLSVEQTNGDARTEEVLPETEGLSVQRNDAEGWLEVDAPADRVWSKLIAHWGALNVDLVASDPKAGIMETDWVEPAKSRKSDSDFAGNVLNQFLGKLFDETTALDKYTITLERQGDARTRINVAHRGIKKIQTQRTTVATNAEWEWVETEEDPDKVRRAISSIIYGLEDGAS